MARQPSKDIVDKLMDWEDGTLSEEDEADLFQELYDSGMLNHLQGMYGRHFRDLERAGIVSRHLDEDLEKDPKGYTHVQVNPRGRRWIQKAIKRPGALHRALGIPEDEDIPENMLRKAARRRGKVGKEARLAETLERFHHRKGRR